MESVHLLRFSFMWGYYIIVNSLFGCQNRAARNSFQLKASLMDLRAFADSTSFTEKKAEKVQWFLRQVSLYLRKGGRVL